MAAPGDKCIAHTENQHAQTLYSDATVNHSSEIDSGGPSQHGMSGEETGCQHKWRMLRLLTGAREEFAHCTGEGPPPTKLRAAAPARPGVGGSEIEGVLW